METIFLNNKSVIELTEQEQENCFGGDKFMNDLGFLLGRIWKAYGESMSYNQLGRL
jgi:hypothetical protein